VSRSVVRVRVCLPKCAWAALALSLMGHADTRHSPHWVHTFALSSPSPPLPQVMRTLSSLAAAGQTVVASIHQPRSSIWCVPPPLLPCLLLVCALGLPGDVCWGSSAGRIAGFGALCLTSYANAFCVCGGGRPKPHLYHLPIRRTPWCRSMYDDLVLLHEGRVVYAGPAQEVRVCVHCMHACMRVCGGGRAASFSACMIFGEWVGASALVMLYAPLHACTEDGPSATLVASHRAREDQNAKVLCMDAWCCPKAPFPSTTCRHCPTLSSLATPAPSTTTQPSLWLTL